MVATGGGADLPSKERKEVNGSKQKELVLCALPWPQEGAQRAIKALKDTFDDVDVEYFQRTDNTEIPADLLTRASYLATLFWLPSQPSDLPNTQFIQFFSAGTNHVAQHPIYTESKIPLCSANGVHGPQIAEWVIMMDLVHSHNYTKLYGLQQKREWKPSAGMNVSDRVGKRVGILGYGSIGRQGKYRLFLQNSSIGLDVTNVSQCQNGRIPGLPVEVACKYSALYTIRHQPLSMHPRSYTAYDPRGELNAVARVAKAMAMDIIAYTASPRKTPESKHDNGYIVPGTGDPKGELPSEWYSGTTREDVHEFLKQEIDLLVIAVPLTEKTRHVLSTPEFELLHKSNPRGTYVANIARGPIIDQKALVDALEKGLIKGAALDVTDPEPLPADDPLWTAPNVLITPHISGSSDVYADRGFQLLIEQIKRKRSGKKLINEVNRERGY
ncbi:hypothetical protein LEMA_P026160.1 [Plenodomus lingam JN3]|uniref:D-isomer specific 2-hydroxyacid dehydrogenase NAD-binding domain-containing protein n=1 Tax=Leptosphaeria maculans (strain JN3 / isolate v23.1.3 / race Av1-4-5-6-7-8) TaxID=985895 RepID=E4ZV38_LEPMJ|nr:hypothetical protein LEMA_P026160.1 [Plenodomus lingam JN3]CBX95464.1 hypothetical protein LEMA_P026160.1 [Plenodomus lingam JN3]